MNILNTITNAACSFINHFTTPLLNEMLYGACEAGDTEGVRLLLQNHKELTLNSGRKSPLHIACKKGYVDIVAALIAKKANVNALTDDGITPLLCACHDNHEAVARLLLDNGAEIDMKYDSNESTVLHEAAGWGHNGIIRLLLEYKANVNALTKNGLTPLFFACQKNCEAAARLLLDNGAEIDMKNDSSEGTVLHEAAGCGHEDIIRLLFEYKANVNALTKDGLTPLFITCHKKCEPAARLLLDNGAEIDMKNGSTETTVLHQAAADGHEGTIRLLLKYKANVNALTKDGLTPLFYACHNNHEAAARLLLDNGAEIDMKNGSTEVTVLHEAAAGGHEGIIRLLLKYKANVNALAKNGLTPLFFACQKNCEAAARLLLDNEAEIDMKNGSTETTVLHQAAADGHKGIIRLLLEYKANVNALNKNGLTPLLFACQKNCEAAARLLLDNGAEIDMKNGSVEGTVLHEAAGCGHEDIIRLLLKYKANMNALNKNGLTPLFYACHDNHEAAARLLLDNDAEIDMKNGSTEVTVLHEAAACGHESIIDLLLRYKSNVNALDKNGMTPLYFACLNHCDAAAHMLLDNGAEITNENEIISFVAKIQEKALKNEQTALYTASDKSERAFFSLFRILSVQKVIFDPLNAHPDASISSNEYTLSILCEPKFQELIDHQAQTMRESLTNVKSNDELLQLKEKCKKVATLLTDTKSLYTQAFQEPLRSRFCKMINIKSANFQQLEGDCTSLSLSFAKVDPAKEFDSMDIFALLADKFGIGISSSIDTVLIEPTENIMSLLQCDFNDLYESGLHEGKDLRLIGIDERFTATDDDVQGLALLHEKAELLKYLQEYKIGKAEEIRELIDQISSVKSEKETLRVLHKQICMFIIRTFIKTKKNTISKLLETNDVATLAELYEKTGVKAESFRWLFSRSE